MPPHPDAVKAAQLTGHRRYLELCDPDHPDYDAAYLPAVRRIARGPSLWARLRSFLAALWRHVRAGRPRTPFDVLSARLVACVACDRLTPADTCGACGCHVARKAAWATEDCPLGRWPRPAAR